MFPSFLNIFVKKNEFIILMKITFKNSWGLLLALLLPLHAISQCDQLINVDLGNDTTLCQGETMSFNLSQLPQGSSVEWENGSTSLNRTINAPGTYSVVVKYLADNIVVNGNFSQGNTGFTTEYTLGTGGTWGLLSNEGTYAISNSPSSVHNNFSYCGDHTTGNGQMFIANGANVPVNAWCQTITVDPNTDYEFSAWVTNALSDFNVAQLQFKINGIPIGDVFTTTSWGCDWQQFFAVWNSGTNTTAEICISNLNTSGGGNDFAIDDISFAPICVVTDTIEIEYKAVPNFTLPTVYNACEGENVTLHAENDGYDYLWSTGSTD